MAKGTVVLIAFPFTELSGSKLRPSVIFSDNGREATAFFITTQLKRQAPTDLPLTPATTNGLKLPSIVSTSKPATVDKALIKGYTGNLRTNELNELDKRLKQLLQLH